MKRPTFSKIALAVLFLLLEVQSFGQNFVPFNTRYDNTLKGDMLLIGNNILSVHPTNVFNSTGTGVNNTFPDNGSNANNDYDKPSKYLVNVDVDLDASTFNSSSANLDIPNPTCYKIVYAGLYWGAVVAGSTPNDKVKFKLPGSSAYIDLTGIKVADINSGLSGSKPYVYYDDVTSLVVGLGFGNAGGTYTVANVSTVEKSYPNTEGISAGWSLIIVYEDPSMVSKYITTFDGFTKVSGNSPQDITVTGFKTIPVGPVRAKYAFSALEGDNPYKGDFLQINGTTISATNSAGKIIRDGSNFFNSSVSYINIATNTPELFLARNPASTNTLGFDAGILNIPNAGNSVIANGATSAKIHLDSSKDLYYFYFNAFAVDVIEPKIILTKTVWNTSGVNIGNQTVNLGQFIDYKITFQNTGNDNVSVFEIKDILPINVIYSGPGSLTLPAGVTVKSWDAPTRTIIFNVNPLKVQVITAPSTTPVSSPLYTIVMRVQVVPDCTLLSSACSNIINNKAFASYTGVINSKPFSEESYDTNTSCLLVPQATNFLANIDGCLYKYPTTLCGVSVDLKAGDGYNVYAWSKFPFTTNPDGTGTPTGPIIGNSQTLTVTNPGTYYVFDTAVQPCRSIMQEFTVTRFGGIAINPVIPFADQVVVCPNDGKKLPLIFLCGQNDSRAIKSGISDGSTIVWEKLNEASCSAVANQDCANESSSCTWTQVGTGPDYTANTAGQFRVTLNYPGGCYNRFYFNVYQNLLNPTETHNDIICNTPGKITIGGVPAGYEYSLSASGPWQPSNVFTINTAGNYTVYIKQTAVTSNPCVFSVPNIQIRKRNFSVTPIVVQPLCHGGKGTVALQINDVRPQYFVTVKQGGVIIESRGPDATGSFQFNNVNPGVYNYTVTTDDGCSTNLSVTIFEPAAITATSALTKPLTCIDGEITVTPIGGTPPFSYFVNSATVFQGNPQIAVTNPLPPGGIYAIRVVDSNNCEATTSITVAASLPPVFTISKTDVLCVGTNSGSITVNVSNANGNGLRYSIDNGVTFVNSNVFTALASGSYNVVVEYTTGGAACLTTPQTIAIVAATAITGTSAVTIPYTCSGMATITATASGGLAPYSYSKDGVTFQPGNIFTGLTNGSYVITIKDSNNCTLALPVVIIAPLTPPTNLNFASSALTCPSNTSNVTVTTIGGALPLTYQIIAPILGTSQASNVFNGLAPNIYTFQVTDAKNCKYQENYSIVALAPIAVSGIVVNNVQCFGSATGSIKYTVSGTTAYSYTINSGGSITGQTASVINILNLAAGTYTIEITDNVTNCKATNSVTVTQPTAALAATIVKTPITCLANGSIIVNATGGWGGYSYSLTPPSGPVVNQVSNIFTNLSLAGTYTVKTTDANGCSVQTNFTLTAAVAPTASLSATSDLCYDGVNAATIVVTAAGGVPPYQYSINNGTSYQASNTFSNLTPGNYTIMVKDAYGCTSIALAQTIAPQLIVATVLTKDLDCTASPNAIIAGSVSGGYPGYNYSVSINGGAFSAPVAVVGTTFTYPVTVASVMAATTYQFQVTDLNNCPSQSGIITIKPISPPAITSVTQTQQIYCNGDTTAAINVVIDSAVGTGPFVINVLNTTTGINYGTQTSGLPAGNYTITITDAKQCTATKTIIILQPTALTASVNHTDITCTGAATSMGSITGTPTGGVSPYTYTITNNVGVIVGPPAIVAGTYTFDILNFGVYELSFTDSNGCSVTNTINIASPPTNLIINTTSGTLSCSSASIIVSVNPPFPGGPYHFALFPIISGSTPPYDYLSNMGSYQNADAVSPPALAGDPLLLQSTFTGLNPGVIYSFIVYDEATNCYYFKQATSPTQTSSTLTSTVAPSNVTCLGASDGKVSFTFTDTYPALTTVSYQIFNSQTNLPTPIPIGTVAGLNGGPIISTVLNVGPLPTGTYYILFKEFSSGSNNGCTNASATFKITESSIPLTISASVIKNQNCNTLGQISVIGQGGTPSYTYQVLLASSPAPTAISGGWVVTNTFNLAGSLIGLNYIAYAKDANGCIKGKPISLLLDPSPVVSAVLNNQCSTAEGSFVIDVTLPTAGIAPYTYSIDGGVFQNKTAPFSIANLSSGIHTVEVKDFNGCRNKMPIPILAPLGLTPTVTALPTCATNDGKITVTATGGSGTYIYSIAPNPASITLAGNVFSGVPAGTYTITVTDGTTTCTKSATVTLDLPTPVAFTAADIAIINVSCNGGNNGVITITLPPSNNNPVYTYEITAPIVRPAQTSNIFAGLSAGTYTVKINSGRGCSATDNSVVVNQPTLLAVDSSSSVSPFGCAANNTVNTSTVTIIATAGSGTAPYTYSIDGTNYFTANIFSIIDNGTPYILSIYIKDSNGCSATSTIAITPLPKITAATIATIAPIDCNNTGSISITVSGGSGNFSYQMLPSGIPQPGNTFAITTPGTYYFRVNDTTTGCYIDTASFVVNPFNTIDVIATATNSITCFGDTNGIISINVTGYSGTYNYQVFDGFGLPVGGSVGGNTTTNPWVISGLSGGNYTVAISETASPFCVKSSNTITIDSPTLPLVVVASQTSSVTCTNNQGTINAVGTGGWGTLQYELVGPINVPYSSNNSFSNLSAGIYTVNVKDAKGCIRSSGIIQLFIPTPIAVIATANTTSLSCFGDTNASITVTSTSGGQGSNYLYTLNTTSTTPPQTSGPQSSTVFTGLGTGTYTVTVTDGWNCSTVSLPITISQPSQVTANLVEASSQTCLNQATLTLSASGGTGLYSYSADGITFFPGNFVSSITFPVAPGTYHYFVKDGNGCTSYITNDIKIDPLPILITNLDLTNAVINCYGDNTGVIVATAQGGLGGYVYTLLNGAGTAIVPIPTQTTPGIFTQLVAGTYQVKVVSGDCIITTSTITIKQPTAPVIAPFVVTDVTCSGAGNGQIIINASGGTGILKYAISPNLNQFFDTNIFKDLTPNTYDVIVQDVLGCYVPFNFTIKEPTAILATTVTGSILPEICSGDNDGEFSIDISGGTPPYRVSLDNVNGPFTPGVSGQTQFDFKNVIGGSHKVYILDTMSCSASWTVVLPDAVSLKPIAIVDYDCLNNAPSNSVTVKIDPSVLPADVDYALDGIPPYQASNVFANVTPGNHFVSARHTNGCIQPTQNFTIIQIFPLAVILNNGGLNEIVATTTGGSGIYHYTFNGESTGTNNTYIYYKTGDYKVIVTDSEGCTATDAKNFTFIDIKIPNVFTPDNDGNNDVWGPTNTENYPDLVYYIFDRYGRKIATYREGQFWDGKYNGMELPSGDYWYTLNLKNTKDEREFVGHFTLYR
jgi:gliding motility-associated-like protein